MLIRRAISIHAPSRERHKTISAIQFSLIFQSTLPRGSDCNNLTRKFFSHHFNPRSLAGATRHAAGFLYTSYISIHAPSRERPFDSCAYVARYIIFQSTLPRGSDFVVLSEDSATVSVDFNPRSLAGATDSGYLVPIFVDISIHAPSRERRIKYNSSERYRRISIHAPSRERLLLTGRNLILLQFQSTLPRGSD